MLPTPDIASLGAPPKYFDATAPIALARAPGRLDVMGGVSRDAGGLCWQSPLDLALTCAVQRTGDGLIEVRSNIAEREGWNPVVSLPAAEVLGANGRETLQALDAASDRWAKYVLGAFVVLGEQDKEFAQSTSNPAACGARIWIESEIPIGVGLGSSSALCVATLAAIGQAFDDYLYDVDVAPLAERIENQIMGAPGDIPAAVTAAEGCEDLLFGVLCQPAFGASHQFVPEDVEIWGINSNVPFASYETYLRWRCAAFMGRRLLRELVPQALSYPAYLSNISLDIWRAVRERIPATMTGHEFLDRFDSHDDWLSTVEPDTKYFVRLATEHPIYEHDRARRFVAFLDAVSGNPAARTELLRAAGDLMIQSHCSYDHRCRLSAPATELIVKLAREAGPKLGIYGAKSTANGAGGTVAVLVDRGFNPDIQSTLNAICQRYHNETGHTAQLLRGSSTGIIRQPAGA